MVLPKQRVRIIRSIAPCRANHNLITLEIGARCGSHFNEWNVEAPVL
jgi:hypothetical protein